MKRLKQATPDEDINEFTDEPMLHSLYHNIGNMPGFSKVGDFVEVRMKDDTLEQHVIVCFQTSRYKKGFFYKTRQLYNIHNTKVQPDGAGTEIDLFWSEWFNEGFELETMEEKIHVVKAHDWAKLVAKGKVDETRTFRIAWRLVAVNPDRYQALSKQFNIFKDSHQLPIPPELSVCEIEKRIIDLIRDSMQPNKNNTAVNRSFTLDSREVKSHRQHCKCELVNSIFSFCRTFSEFSPI